MEQENNGDLPPKRRYDSSRRKEASEQNRRNVIASAQRLFIEQGYTQTTMAMIAADAGVSHETVYTMFGPKPAVLRYLIETALSGGDGPVPALQRDSTLAMQAESDPVRVVEMFAGVVRRLQERLSPLFDVLIEGAHTDPDLKALATELDNRRAIHMGMLASELAEKGGLREGMSVDEARDVIWMLNSAEFYMLCVRGRGWTPDYFEAWLRDALKRLLLK